MYKYSIIIPTLNEASCINECLLALQALRPECQLIVTDAGSTDQTREIALPLVDIFITAPKGRAVQMNAGAQKASAEVLLFLHADTFLPRNALGFIQHALNNGAQWGRFDMQLVGKHFMLKVVATMMNWRSRLTGIATGDQVIFVRRAAFRKVACFPEIALMEDVAISKRLKKISKGYCLTAQVQSSGRRWEDFGVWRTIVLMWSLRLRYFLGTEPDTLAQLYRQGKIFNKTL
ncbi:TIGR04283 family arsenosugar biosynthesis glycosyltransferase [methanotrophic endosymbiont of Bathymodiolus puteoserpentis (Logatchev)]|uniref:TIGR04283 family arsenosugar biosynthesis glycosyltransferase n=1 Tax=methanotrophic endosymbiont of Bathymodiolus puteoserpentis (Logatchev) TaxID=343235 RepID=UPI0013C8F052|nr:TIGR04283 family arsenosugar biosynthesis glycosyltransferase [methanotrophic endosymbiont of Bathymodiolus puteoserpentis (Logatchev)]SHE23439.1 Glycosyl transferase, family 2 [methanotrophic endosymbiont of Bathymodiolus puteoserpentis (Logatchev)]